MDTERKPPKSPHRFGKGNPGRPKGAKNRISRDVRQVARSLIEDEVYLRRLRERLHSGEVSPPVETMLWYYAFGKPAETVELGPQAASSLAEVIRRASNG